MFNSKNYIEKPIHLVSINSFGKLVLHYEAINHLKTLKSPISVLSIAGPYRTGKSFLLNSLISSSESLGHQIISNQVDNNYNESKFQVGHTTNQTTHGLWIWSKPILAYNQNNQITNVIVMDSQGYASSQSTHDKRLITLAILLSTCFLYNSKGAIDKDSIFDLQFVIQVARLINQKYIINNIKKDDNLNHNCDFHWILRDFHLELINQIGTKINPNQYMENCLLQAQSKVNQKTIQTLKKHFPHRYCHTLCQPSLDQNKEQRPQFISQILQLRQKILKKQMKSFNMSGQSFVSLIKSYVDAMNNGQQIDSVFQQGYDCQVRLDCLQKLNHKLKKLQQNSKNDDRLDDKLSNIKSQIKLYYKQRMCSHKQIKVLDNDVQQIIQQYEQERSSKYLSNSTSVKCVQKQPIKRMILSVPKTIGHLVRPSIHCSEGQEKSFTQEESCSDFQDSRHNFRASRMMGERKSVQKQKISPQIKALSGKIQDLELKLHRTQLQLSIAQGQITQIKSQNEYLKQNITNKQDQMIQLMQSKSITDKQNNQKIQQLTNQLKQQAKKNKILESEIQKINLLYNQKIQFLQSQIRLGDEQKLKQFQEQKLKYKIKVKQLSQDIQQLKSKHSQQIQQIRQIFTREQQKKKSYFHLKTQYDFDQDKNIYEQFSQKLKQIQSLKNQIDRYKLQVNSLKQQLSLNKFKQNQIEQNLNNQIQQLNKRNLQIQQNLKSIYQSKIQTKQVHVAELQTKIKSLNQILNTQNQKLIKKLEEINFNHSEQKEDLYNMNNQLRIGCLQALQRVSSLREELDVKDQRIRELQEEKKCLNKKIVEKQQISQRQAEKWAQIQNKLKNKMNQSLQKQYKEKQQLKQKLKQSGNQVQRHLEKIKKLSLQVQLQKQHNIQLNESVSNLTKQLSMLQHQLLITSQTVKQKQFIIEQLNSQKQVNDQKLQKQVILLTNQLEECKKQKSQLIQSLSMLNKQLQEKYQNLELMFNQKYQYQNKKYEANIKQIKQHQRKQSIMSDQSTIQCIKLQEKLKYTQKQNYQLIKQKQSLIKQKQKIQAQLKQIIAKYQQQQKEYIKQLALANHKISFNQDMINRQKEEISKLNKDLQQKQEKYENQLKKIKQQIISKDIEINNIKLIQIKLTEQNSKIKEENNKNSQLKQSLQKKIRVHLSDKECLQSNLAQLQELIRVKQINYQNHLRLFSQKLKKVKSQKQQLQNKLSTQNNLSNKLKNQLNLLGNNYQKDFKLWTSKMQKMEQLLIQAGWKEYNTKNIHLNKQQNYRILNQNTESQNLFKKNIINPNSNKNYQNNKCIAIKTTK